MEYRREIDGLRAIAVVPVILFHAGFSAFKGGFVGVDVFLVISGYLITTIILNELNRGEFSIILFYERRARRILPTLFLVIAACIPFAWFWFFTNQLRDFSESLIAVALFVSNFLFWRQSGYFDTAAELKPLLHTWSLAVEEQYYVFFPIILALIWRLGRRWIVALLSITLIVSLALAQRGSNLGSSAAFYLLPTRAWELLIGALVALVLARPNVNYFGKYLSEAGGWIGIFMVLFSIFAFDKSIPFPSLYTLAPTIGTALIILFATHRTIIGKLIGNRVFVGIGLVSYSAYLWHQPLFALGKTRNFGDMGPFLACCLVLISFLLAYLSWLYIETPIRKRQILASRRSIFLASAAGIFLLSGAGLYGVSENYLGKRFTPSYLRQYESKSDYISDNFYLISESWELQRKINGVAFFGVDNIPKDREFLFDLEDKRKKLLIVGNSHSVDFYNVMHYSEKISSKYQLARFGTQIRNIDSALFSSPNYRAADAVVYCSLMSDDDIGHIERIISRSLSDQKMVFFCKNMFTWMERANFTKLDKMIIAGLSDGKSFPSLASEINNFYSEEVFNQNYVDFGRKRDAGKLAAQLNRLSERYDFKIIDRMSYVCPERKCKLVSDSLGKYFFDMGHHTMLGARYFSSVVDNGNFLNELTADASPPTK